MRLGQGQWATLLVYCQLLRIERTDGSGSGWMGSGQEQMVDGNGSGWIRPEQLELAAESGNNARRVSMEDYWYEQIGSSGNTDEQKNISRQLDVCTSSTPHRQSTVSRGIMCGKAETYDRHIHMYEICLPVDVSMPSV